MRLSTSSTPNRPEFRRNRLLHAVMAAFGVIWLAAAVAPRDRADWAMENLLVVSLIGGLAGTYRVLPLSDVSYLCLAAFLLLHTMGAHYTYPEVPLGEWAGDRFGWERNHYDRLVHFGFGLLMAYPIREVVLRGADVRGPFSYFLAVETTLALSAAYELLEWGAATVLAPELGSVYLGAQGDEWDAQKDMLAAVAGAVIAMTITATAGRRPPGSGPGKPPARRGGTPPSSGRIPPHRRTP